MSDGVFGGKVTAPVTVVTILDERRNAGWYIFFLRFSGEPAKAQQQQIGSRIATWLGGPSWLRLSIRSSEIRIGLGYCRKHYNWSWTISLVKLQLYITILFKDEYK